MQGDLTSYIEARRRARGELAAADAQSAAPQGGAPSAPTVDSETERRNRVIAANLGLGTNPAYGYDPKAGGGVFQVANVEYDRADLYFYGWNPELHRNSKQLIEVAKGDYGDIRTAVVLKIISIIREHEPGDFTWVSERLGRTVTLSARPSDDAGLQAFIWQEFFGDLRGMR